jgi:hypothetical protein
MPPSQACLGNGSLGAFSLANTLHIIINNVPLARAPLRTSHCSDSTPAKALSVIGAAIIHGLNRALLFAPCRRCTCSCWLSSSAWVRRWSTRQ